MAGILQAHRQVGVARPFADPASQTERRATASAVCTIGASSEIDPGRTIADQFLHHGDDARTAPARVLLDDRPIHGLAKLRIERGQRRRIRRPQIDLHPGLGGNRVHRRPAANPSDVECRPRVARAREIPRSSPRAAERIRRIRQPELREAVAAWPLERDAVAVAADADDRDVRIRRCRSRRNDRSAPSASRRRAPSSRADRRALPRRRWRRM